MEAVPAGEPWRGRGGGDMMQSGGDGMGQGWALWLSNLRVLAKAWRAQSCNATPPAQCPLLPRNLRVEEHKENIAQRQCIRCNLRVCPSHTLAPAQVCNALKHMHDRRMMHRDLKPSNIFVTASGDLKLGDLGLSRYFSSRTLQVQQQRPGAAGRAGRRERGRKVARQAEGSPLPIWRQCCALLGPRTGRQPRMCGLDVVCCYLPMNHIPTTSTHQHSRVLTSTHQHSPTLTNTHQHSPPHRRTPPSGRPTT